MKTISVITTTQFRRKKNGDFFVEDALASITSQIADDVKFESILGIDEGDEPPESFHGAIFAEGKGLAEVTNAAFRKASGDYIAMLEDDDTWTPMHIQLSLKALEAYDFVSGTALEIDEDGTVLRINDFATPSTWLMPRKTFEAAGFLDTSLAIHYDNGWLGQLNRTGLKRCHLVEATAPVLEEHISMSRPGLANIFRVATLGRHPSPWPLIERSVHKASGMWSASTNKEKLLESNLDYARLATEYGEVPW